MEMGTEKTIKKPMFRPYKMLIRKLTLGMFFIILAFNSCSTKYENTNEGDLMTIDSVWVEELGRYHPKVSMLKAIFTDAAKEFNVPEQLLMAIGALENNWTQMDKASIDQGWGIMHLTDHGNCNTLSLAAEILHVNENQLKSSAELNIRGAAAVLDKYATDSGIDKDSLNEWIVPMAAFSCLIDSSLRRKQANEYLRIAKNGYTAPTLWGDTIVITPK